MSVLAWVMLTGLVLVIPLTAAGGHPQGLGSSELGWLALSGLGNVVGLLLSYTALRTGKVSLVGPITSTEGAIAAVLAVLAGEALGPGVGITLGVIAVGVVLAGTTSGSVARDPAGATVLACFAAVCFGIGLYATARVSEELPLVWALVPARVVGVGSIAVPLIVTRRLRITSAAMPLVVASGLCEVAGFAAYAIAARHAIAIAAVLASQFAALAAVAAYVLFGERLTRLQLAGVVTIAAGVAVLSALQA